MGKNKEDGSAEPLPFAQGVKKLSRKERCKNRLCTKENLLLIFIVIGVAIGIALGAGLYGKGLTKREVMYLSFPGELFLRMLKAMILPLIISSLISGLAALDAKLNGRMGWVTVVYYMCTTFLAVFLGIALVYAIKPGYYGAADGEVGKGGSKPSTVADTFLDLIRSMFPKNLVAACIEKESTTLYPPMKKVIPTSVPEGEPEPVHTTLAWVGNYTDSEPEPEPEYIGGDPDDPYTWEFKTGTKTPGENIMGIVVFCVAFGIIISRLGEKGKPLKDFFDAMNEAIMKIVHIIMWFSPVGICFLIAGKIVTMDDPNKMLGRIGMYMATIISGLSIHAFIFLPVLYFIFTRKNPLWHFVGVMQALLTAAGTASSSATLPITISNIEDNCHVDSRVARFVLPVGATINMDGTALYEAVAVLFIAQVNGRMLGAGEIIALSITATAASVGAAGIPEAGLVTMYMVLTAVGLPVDDISLILSVDWLLDRFRTAVNVWGDSVGAGIVEHLVQNQLPPEVEGDDVIVSKTLASHPEGTDGDYNYKNYNPGYDNAALHDWLGKRPDYVTGDDMTTSM